MLERKLKNANFFYEGNYLEPTLNDARKKIILFFFKKKVTFYESDPVKLTKNVLFSKKFSVYG